MRYRRFRWEGSTYFFTVVSFNRQRLFDMPEMIELLREAFHKVKQSHPFKIDAIVVLPDHLHCLWTLPEGDADFSTRWRFIKGEFSRRCPEKYKQPCSMARYQKQEQAIWQRRFWEHLIRNDNDFANHVEYIHYNPVKHGLVKHPKDWLYSSIHRFKKIIFEPKKPRFHNRRSG